MSVNNVKGTHDVIGEEANGFNYIENLLKQICELFAYNEVRPPVMEYSELFVRGVGESSDVVRKEMYTFLDKAERSVTLRPEFTAGIMRLIIQNKLLSIYYVPHGATHTNLQGGRDSVCLVHICIPIPDTVTDTQWTFN